MENKMPLDEIVKEGEVEIELGSRGKKIVYSTLWWMDGSYSTIEPVQVRELEDKIEVTYHTQGNDYGAPVEKKIDSHPKKGTTVRIARKQLQIFDK